MNYFSSKISGMKRLLNDFSVNVCTQLHALLKVATIVTLSALCFNVLLDRINLAFVTNQSFLNFIETVVNVTLQDLVLTSVMTHSVIGRLLAQWWLVLANHILDHLETLLLLLKPWLQIFHLGKLVLHLIFHFVNTIRNSIHFLINSRFKISNLF